MTREMSKEEALRERFVLPPKKGQRDEEEDSEEKEEGEEEEEEDEEQRKTAGTFCRHLYAFSRS
jgi:hypothetical protein